MIAASAVIRMGPFRKLGGLLGYAEPHNLVASAAEVAMIRRAVEAWARRLPWRTLCYEQGVTTHWLLRRRKRQSTLYYGAATIGGELKAHVWVKSGGTDVIGCENADEYALLARFPDEPAVSIGSRSR